MWTDSQEALVENRLVQMSDPAPVLFSDGNTAVGTAARILICTVPAGSLLIGAYVLKLINFNAQTNDYLTVGTYDDDDLLVNDLDVATAAATIPVIVDTTTFPYYVSADTPIYATYIYSGTAPTTGSLQVALLWVPWNVRERVAK
jgi:hypothetical protein